MNTFNLLMSVISESLKFIDVERATEIQKKLQSIGEQWDEEFSKGSDRDDAKLAFLDRELLDAGKLFLTAIKGSKP